MMRRLGIAALLLAAAGCGAGANGEWDAQAAASLKTESETMFKLMDAGDMSGMVAHMDPDVMVFDLDENNRPVKLVGLDPVKQYMDHLTAAAKAQALKFSTTGKMNECRATATMGYCAVEFDQTVTAGGQTMGPFKFRGTLVARRVGGAWKWVHWHGSFAEIPKQP